MAKKSAERMKPKGIRHARIELPNDEYEVLEDVARSIGLSVSAYIRMAVLQRVRRDKAEMSGEA